LFCSCVISGLCILKLRDSLLSLLYLSMWWNVLMLFVIIGVFVFIVLISMILKFFWFVCGVMYMLIECSSEVLLVLLIILRNVMVFCV